MATDTWLNIGSGNGLLPDSNINWTIILDTCLNLMATLNPNTCILITLIYILTISVFLQDSIL